MKQKTCKVAKTVLTLLLCALPLLYQSGYLTI